MCYLKGRGVAKDREQAMVWLQHAADAGHENAKRMTRT
jgi:TPR repeat protein